MGWIEAREIFDPVAQALIDVGASDEIKTRTCNALIKALQSWGWEAESDSLERFAGDPAIVAAFRENRIIRHCCERPHPTDVLNWCVLEINHDEDHKGYHGKTWPRTS